ncbi:MAG: hypothetical protein RLN87_12835 [Parasphingopyxis sp.]|uniref:type VI toxin-antitoxin system SocB family DNA replication inhibitor toxin n=1 Tax=Parasphingopyxis sp. TaxID=1920299 RepID=UPI0032ECBCA5
MTRQLPITDLARATVLPLDEQYYALQQVKSGGGRGSYRPTRQNLPDIVNRHPGMFPAKRAPWRVVRDNVLKKCSSDTERRMNRRAAKAIYDYCQSENVSARELDGYPLSLSIGLKLMCWSPALFVYDDRISVPFFDMRRTYKLTRDANTFMFSVMHHALRVNNPDYRAVKFEILRLRDSKTRDVFPIMEGSRNLFSYEEIEAMVRVTHTLWLQIIEDRDAEARAAGQEWASDTFFGKSLEQE